MQKIVVQKIVRTNIQIGDRLQEISISISDIFKEPQSQSAISSNLVAFLVVAYRYL